MNKNFVFGALAGVAFAGLLAFAMTSGARSAPTAYAPAEPMMQAMAYAGAPADMPAAPAAEMDMKEEKVAMRKQVMRNGLLGSLGGKGMGAGGMAYGTGVGTLSAAPKPMAIKMKDKADEAASDDGIAASEGGEAGSSAVASRSWFPETFLFAPLVVTDEAGQATIPVKVPDRLTSWRVLALAHSREGQQAGASTSFLGTLPAYVDPVVPPFLIAGDEVKLPLQIVNTTENELAKALSIDGVGAKITFASKTVKVPAQGSHVEYAELAAPRAGSAVLKATLSGTDAVEREIPVRPSGRPVELHAGGTLAAPREVTLDGPADLDHDSAKAELVVFPGALSLVRSELAGSLRRGSVADDAYTLLLAGRADSLLQSLGDKADPEAVRTLSVLAGQRVIREGRAPSVDQACLLAEAALAHPENPVLARLGERLSDQVARAQRPDGTFQGATGWTLQRLLVTTAECLRAVKAGENVPRLKQKASLATVKASGAFERNLGHVTDAYTAAAIVASGAVSGPVSAKLRELVRKAVQQRPDGSRYVAVEKGTVRADGNTPSEAEATALAALALDGDSEAPWRADLGATLLGTYEPAWGWGDGRTNLIALRAVLGLFKDKLPASVHIVLEQDGAKLADGTLDTANVKDALTLSAAAPQSGGSHKYTVRAEPAVPGLGYSLKLKVFVPWKAEPANEGLELSVTPPKEAKVGEPSDLLVEATAPMTQPLKITTALPAGMQADSPSLDALVNAGTVTRYRNSDGEVELEIPARSTPQAISAKFRVIPTLAGKLHSGPSTIAAVGRSDMQHVPPAVWTIR